MKDRLKIATEAVLSAGALIVELQLKGATLEFKADKSPVTNADKASEQTIRQILLKAYPNDGFIGEEFPAIPARSPYTWSCDPIDGTWSYLNHEKTTTISLALHEGEKTVLAVIYNPFTNDLYTGGEGLPSTLNGHALPRVHKPNLQRSVVNFFISRTKIRDINILYELRYQRIITKVISQGGSLAHALAMVASGANNVFIGNSHKPSNIWDLAAGAYLIRSIGGRVSNIAGEELDTIPANTVVVASTNTVIHNEVLQVLAEKDFGKPY